MARQLPMKRGAATLLGVLLAAFAAAAGAQPVDPAASPAATGANPGAGDAHARVLKIHALATDLGYGAEYHHLDTAIPYLALWTGESDPAWKPSHPRWDEVCAVIGQDLHADAQESFAETQRTVLQGAERALDAALSEEELAAALAFFRSPVGQHYLDLQSALIDISIEVTLGKNAEPGTAAPEALDARRQVIELWLPIIFTRALSPPKEADEVIGPAAERLSQLRGAKLDALAKRHAEDVPRFHQFLDSRVFADIVDAIRQAGQRGPAPNLPVFFGNEMQRHGAAWRSAYLGT